MNCIHGIDSRFCAVCNKTPKVAASRHAVGNVSLEEILRFLNEEQVRATYGAVAEVVGLSPRAMGAVLGPHRPEASWIVNASNGLPADYSEDQWHSALLSRAEIINSGRLLTLRLSVWKKSRTSQ
jgi:alkylated DNA nucleotide flippase Atl1